MNQSQVGLKLARWIVACLTQALAGMATSRALTDRPTLLQDSWSGYRLETRYFV